MAEYISQITLPNNVTYDLKDAAALSKSGGILTGGLEIKGHIAGDGSTTTGHGLYGGGMYHNAYNNIILHGDASTGSSGIAFISDKVAADGTITNRNAPSDRAFIQYHACGVTTATAEGTNPTLASGNEEAGRLVIGIGNDAGDKIILQAPGTTDIIHQIDVNSYPIPHTTNTNGSVGGTTTPVYVDAGVIKAGTALGASAYHADSYFALASHGTHVTTATVQEALSINTSSGSATKALTEKGTFVTFGTSNLTIGTTSSTAMAGNTVVTNVAISANTTTNANYPIVFATSNKDTTAAKNEGLQKSGAKFYFNPSTGNVQATTFNGYTLAAASAKGVVTTIDTSANLPTSNAVKTFVEGKGYVTSSGVTSVATGVGLTGGTITSTGTIKAYLKSETNATYDSATVTNTSSRQYAVTPDKTGYLSVNVPWTDNNTATATDNILDGSNSGTAITYAPYAAQQSKLSFDTSTTAPTRTDRLNLNGFLYATQYNVAGKVTLQWNATDQSLDFVFA